MVNEQQIGFGRWKRKGLPREPLKLNRGELARRMRMEENECCAPTVRKTERIIKESVNFEVIFHVRPAKTRTTLTPVVSTYLYPLKRSTKAERKRDLKSVLFFTLFIFFFFSGRNDLSTGGRKHVLQIKISPASFPN